MPALEADGLTCHYGARAVVRDFSLTAAAGTLTALLGPNGAGKSTLLRAFAGLGDFTGTVRICGEPISSLSRREIARRVALVPQDPPCDAPFTVRELVLMGRAPHLGRLALEGPSDLAIAVEAMRSADVLDLADRPIDEISGGERRRAFLARALAQRPRILLLDEPTAFLDLGHQASVLEHARRLADDGLCVLAVLHDPSLASAFADRAVLLGEGRRVAEGPVSEVLTGPVLEKLFGTRLFEVPGPGGATVFGPFSGRSGNRPER